MWSTRYTGRATRVVHTSRTQRRGRTYYFRRRIPGRLHALLGRVEIIRSLRTELRPEAIRRARQLDEQISALFTMSQQPRTTPEEVERLIRRLVDDYVERWMDEDRRDRRRQGDLSGHADAFEMVAHEMAEELDDGRVGAVVQREAKEALERAGVELEGQPLRDLEWEVARATIGVLRRTAEERRGDLLGQPRPEEVRDSGPPSAEGHRRAGVTLAEAFAKYIREKSWSAVYEKTGLADDAGQ